jgi:hypothetical protein
MRNYQEKGGVVSIGFGLGLEKSSTGNVKRITAPKTKSQTRTQREPSIEYFVAEAQQSDIGLEKANPDPIPKVSSLHR